MGQIRQMSTCKKRLASVRRIRRYDRVRNDEVLQRAGLIWAGGST